MAHKNRHSPIKAFFLRLARADIVFYILPFFMLVLTLGTLAQGDMGLYAAHQKYFASAFFMWGLLPLPGGYLLIGLFTLNLLFKFLLGSEWRWRKLGIILSHAGALVLLLGGLLTAIFAQESYMVIPEGQSSAYIYDYHQRDLFIYRDDTLAALIPFEEIKEARAIAIPESGAVLTPIATCENCKIERRADVSQDFGGAPLQSLAQFMALETQGLEKDAEANLSGMTASLSGGEGDADGIYLAFEAMPKPISFSAGGADYKIVLGKRQRDLPFAIKLVDFEKQTYAGSNSAKEYAADIVVEDGGASWPARISMNKPLRHKGYTFYQSAYEQSEVGEATILAVVQNKGRIFPYLGTIILTIGLLVHFIIVLRRRLLS